MEIWTNIKQSLQGSLNWDFMILKDYADGRILQNSMFKCMLTTFAILRQAQDDRPTAITVYITWTSTIIKTVVTLSLSKGSSILRSHHAFE